MVCQSSIEKLPVTFLAHDSPSTNNMAAFRDPCPCRTVLSQLRLLLHQACDAKRTCDQLVLFLACFGELTFFACVAFCSCSCSCLPSNYRVSLKHTSLCNNNDPRTSQVVLYIPVRKLLSGLPLHSHVIGACVSPSSSSVPKGDNCFKAKPWLKACRSAQRVTKRRSGGAVDTSRN